jgi:hypothetical protein
VPTHHRRIQITEEPELISPPRSEPERQALLDSLAETFDDPAAAGVGWDALRESKQLAWPAR